MLSVHFVELALETSDQLFVYCVNCYCVVFERLLDKLLLLCVEPLALLFGNQVFKRIAVSHCWCDDELCVFVFKCV